LSNTLQKTKTPGIYSKGARYIVVYRDPSGRQRKKSCKTYSEARDTKAALNADVARGEYRESSKLTFSEYAPQWADSYQGRTSKGIRPETIAEYRRDLGITADGSRHPAADGALAFFGRMRLTAIEPRHLKEYASVLRKRGLSPNSVRLAIAPVKLLLSTAFEEGLIRANPGAGLRLNGNEGAQEAEERAKALTEEELKRLLQAIPEGYRPFFDLLAQTGLRVSEAAGLQWGDVDLGCRRLKVRRRLYQGKLAPPKTSFGRRTLPLSLSLTQTLWKLKKGAAETDFVFTNRTGNPLDTSNVFSRVLKPAAVEAGLGSWELRAGRKIAQSWVGFHTFRHTCASVLFRQGWNAKQVQAFLGHHSPAFTLAVYVHLLPDDLPAPDFFDSMFSAAATKEEGDRATEGQPDPHMQPETAEAEIAV
jgi:integrase